MGQPSRAARISRCAIASDSSSRITRSPSSRSSVTRSSRPDLRTQGPRLPTTMASSTAWGAPPAQVIATALASILRASEVARRIVIGDRRPAHACRLHVIERVKRDGGGVRLCERFHPIAAQRLPAALQERKDLTGKCSPRRIRRRRGGNLRDPLRGLAAPGRPSSPQDPPCRRLRRRVRTNHPPVELA